MFGGISLLLFSSVSSIQSLSHVQLFATPWTTPGFPVYHQLPELAQTHIHRAGKAIQQSHPVIPLLLLPSVYPSHRVFCNESVLHIRWPKYWSFSFSISPSNEYSGLIFFRIDWFDLLAFQGTLQLSRVFSTNTVQRHQFFSIQPFWWSNSCICIWLFAKP